MSGPTTDRSLGIYVIRAGSRADAEAIASSDPFTAAGHCTFELHEWEVHQILGIGQWEFPPGSGPGPQGGRDSGRNS